MNEDGSDLEEIDVPSELQVAHTVAVDSVPVNSHIELLGVTLYRGEQEAYTAILDGVAIDVIYPGNIETAVDLMVKVKEAKRAHQIGNRTAGTNPEGIFE
ncbi:hypothetical protein [Halanaeroarchaeum sp. HSR-CO]|uniref:hypothetical protein n=1 Tax=Halanaeroarchaeum sp. HSR-CO TaxID=2866382 RepID=UPI00217EA971|nr:hypothetical protein [Halanaeroarchaeum sp. HSR-CO]